MAQAWMVGDAYPAKAGGHRIRVTPAGKRSISL